MKVKELIEQLQQCNPEAEVVADLSDYSDVDGNEVEDAVVKSAEQGYPTKVFIIL